MKKTLKKEQVDLLKFEKQLLGLGAGLGALTTGAAANAENMVGEVAAEHAAQMQDAYLALVETVQAAHNAIELSAIEAGIEILQVRGQPKDSAQLLELAKSILGIG